MKRWWMVLIPFILFSCISTGQAQIYQGQVPKQSADENKKALYGNSAFADSIELETMDSTANNIFSAAGWITGVAGVLLGANTEEQPLRYILVMGGGIGCIAGSLFGIKAIDNAENITRLKYAIINESEFTEKEIDSIKRKTIFVGMSSMAARASWGTPTTINRASYGDQWVYREFNSPTAQYLYVEDDVVTAWN